MAHYLLIDVCLLADVFNNFCHTSIPEYNFDLAYFINVLYLA